MVVVEDHPLRVRPDVPARDVGGAVVGALAVDPLLELVVVCTRDVRPRDVFEEATRGKVVG